MDQNALKYAVVPLPACASGHASTGNVPTTTFARVHACNFHCLFSPD